MGGAAVGRTLENGYRITRHLGSGGMGDVYEAEQIPFGRRVAIKVIPIADRAALDRARQEALLMARLPMPHVVTVLDFRIEGAEALLVMELLEGVTVHDALARMGPMPLPRAIAIADQVLEALEAAHAAGIVHRDIKPSNIFLVRDARGGDFVKLIDFGVAKPMQGSLVSTTTGGLVGTPSYMAPEQLRGERATPSCDLHALAVCLFQMLTGQRPWRSPPGAQLVAEILRDEPLRLRAVRGDLSPALDALLARAMARETSGRFPDALAMRTALRVFSADATTRRSGAPDPLVPTDPGSTRVAPRTTRKLLVLPLAIVGSVIVSSATTGAILLRRMPRRSALAGAPSASKAGVPDEATIARNEETSWRMWVDVNGAPVWTAGPPGDCYCAYDGVFPVFCDKPQTPKCDCETVAGNACTEPLAAGRTCSPDSAAFGGDGKRTGDACSGWARSLDGTSKEVRGALACDVCYSPRPFRGANGAPCTGLSRAGIVHDGKLVCGKIPPRGWETPKVGHAATTAAGEL